MSYEPTIDDIPLPNKVINNNSSGYDPQLSDIPLQNYQNSTQNNNPQLINNNQQQVMPPTQGMNPLIADISRHPSLSAAINTIGAPARALEPVSNAIIKYVNYMNLPSLAGGILQGVGDIATSVANAPLQAIGYKGIPHGNLKEYLPDNLSSNTAFEAGDIGGSLAALGPVFSGAQKAIQAPTNIAESISGYFPNVSKYIPDLSNGYGGIAKNAAAGAATGYATGEEAPGGREVGAALGAALPPVLSARSGAVANNIADDKKAIEDLYRSKYDTLFNDAKQQGIDTVPIDSSNDTSRIIGKTAGKYNESLKNYLSDQSLPNAHKAQSDLGTYIRYIDRISKNQTLTSSELKTLDSAMKVRSYIQTSIDKSLSNSNNNLGQGYKDISQGYKNDVVPYKGLGIEDYVNNKIKPNTLLSNLNKDDQFMLSMGKKYPQLMLNKMLGNYITKALISGGALGVGAKVGYGKYDESG